jgi:hypothetical protein
MSNRNQDFDMHFRYDYSGEKDAPSNYSIEVDEGEENFIIINLENVDRFVKALLDFRDLCESKKAEPTQVKE